MGEPLTLNQRAWQIVHNEVSNWWNDYARRYPNSTVSESGKWESLAHWVAKAALTTKAAEDAATIAAKNARIAELEGALESMNAVTCHQTGYGHAHPLFGADHKRTGPVFHPLTCGHDSQRHEHLMPLWEDGRVKLVCPQCDYVQDNAGMFSTPAVANGRESDGR